MEKDPGIEPEFQIPTKDEVVLDQERILFINKVTGWFRFFLGVFTAVVVTLLIVNVTFREKAVDSCKARKAVWTEFVGFLDDAAQARRDEGDIETADQYAQRSARIKLRISGDCEEENPPLIPFIG